MRIKTGLRLASGAAALLVATGCSADLQAHTDPASPAAGSVASPGVVHPDAPLVVKGEAALTRPYALPSLKEFANDPFVAGVIQGTVTNIDTVVSDDQNTVHSVITVKVLRGGGLKSGSTVDVVELGGVVPLREVRSQFEGKDFQAPLTEADLDKMVDFQMEGITHSAVGDEVVMFLSDNDRQRGVYTLAAKLAPLPGKDSGYGWLQAGAPNPAWGPTFSSTEIQSLLASKTALTARN